MLRRKPGRLSSSIVASSVTNELAGKRDRALLGLISTTERYLGIEQDLDTAPCDTMDIEAGTNRMERK
jgi:hypothetical protein